MQTYDSLDLPYQERLAIFRVSKPAAQAEILRVKGIYRTEESAGASALRLAEIQNWANQVRSAAGISKDDPVYGDSQNISTDIQAALTNFVSAMSNPSASDSTTGIAGVRNTISSNSGMIAVFAFLAAAFLIFGGKRGRK